MHDCAFVVFIREILIAIAIVGVRLAFVAAVLSVWRAYLRCDGNDNNNNGYLL